MGSLDTVAALSGDRGACSSDRQHYGGALVRSETCCRLAPEHGYKEIYMQRAEAARNIHDDYERSYLSTLTLSATRAWLNTVLITLLIYTAMDYEQLARHGTAAFCTHAGNSGAFLGGHKLRLICQS